MAGDWLKIEIDTPDKPEIWAMADDLGIDPDAVFGKLFRVWSWFDQHTESGNAPSVTKSLLDRKVGVTGFVNSMLKAGWLVEEEGVITMPNFEKHNGNSAKKRANTAKRVAKHKINQQLNDANEKVTPEALPREEKRREEKNNINSHENVVSVTTNCPHQKIIDLYHKHLPVLPNVKVWNESRSKHLKARWDENKNHQTLEFWERLFIYINEKCDHLIGRNDRGWVASLVWIVKAENFAKIIEGNYEKRSNEKAEAWG